MTEDASPSPSGNPDNQEGYSEDTIQQFINAQLEDARLRERELDIREQELELNKEQAEASLEAQIQDRENERRHFNDIHKRNSRYGMAIITLAAVFLGFLVYVGHPDIALELVKLAAFGGGGYYAGKKVGESTSQNQE